MSLGKGGFKGKVTQPTSSRRKCVIPEADLPEIFDLAGKTRYPGPIVMGLSVRPGSRLI